MANLSDVLTDKKLDELEKRIRREYSKAWYDLKKKTDAYFKSFEKQDALMYQELLDGNITQEHYDQWRINHLAIGEQWEQTRDEMAWRMTHADEVAAAYMNDTTPGIYSLNYNYSAFELESEAYKIAKAKNLISPVNFNIINEQTVKRLMTGDVSILPRKKVNIPKSLLWNKQKIQSELLSGILQGESATAIAQRFKNVVGMNERAAIRNARTAVTGAQNAGRYESYIQSQKMGFPVVKKWISTLDPHTRESHRRLDGEMRELEEPFSNGLQYPGDPFGLPKEVYNCRCTMSRVVQGITDSFTSLDRFARDENMDSAVATGVTYYGRDNTMSYEEWLRSKGGM